MVRSEHNGALKKREEWERKGGVGLPEEILVQ